MTFQRWDKVTFGLLGCKCTFPGQAELLIHKHLQVLLSELLPVHSHSPACVCARADPALLPSLSSPRPSSAACPGPSAWHPLPATAWHHQQTLGAALPAEGVTQHWCPHTDPRGASLLSQGHQAMSSSFGCDHPASSSSTQLSICQIHVSPAPQLHSFKKRKYVWISQITFLKLHERHPMKMS